MDKKDKRFSLMPISKSNLNKSNEQILHHRRVASADAEPNDSFGSQLDSDSRNAPSSELQPLLTLVHDHSKKTYFSGYLAARTVKTPEGKPLREGDPRAQLQGVFVKLIGTVFNVWNRREIESAAAQNSAVPPKYINVADAYAEIVGSIFVSVPPPEYQRNVNHVFSLNFAGLNKQEYVAPDERTLHNVVHAIRLSAWEKKRLEELYTGHLLRILQRSNLPGNSGRQPFIDPRSPLIKGKMEGWVRVRFVGTAHWQRLWLVLTNYRPQERKRSFFGGSSNNNNNILNTSLASQNSFPTPPQPSAIASFYQNKNVKSSTKPVYTLTLSTQAFAVFPERLELIGHSGLFKIEGILQNQVDDSTIASISGLREDGWCLIMPQLDEKTPATSAWVEMLKWLIGFHDCFNLYGRPKAYSWDPRDPKSLFFSYPIGPQKHKLFLDCELAQTTDVFETRSWAIRANLLGILRERMLPPSSQPRLRSSASTRPSSMSINTTSSSQTRDQTNSTLTNSRSFISRPASLSPGVTPPSRQPPSIPSTINHSPILSQRLPDFENNDQDISGSSLGTSLEPINEFKNESNRSSKNDILTNRSFSNHVASKNNEENVNTGGDYNDGNLNSNDKFVNENFNNRSNSHEEYFREGERYLDNESTLKNGRNINNERNIDQPPIYTNINDNVNNSSPTISSPSLNTPFTVGEGSIEEQTARAANELRRKLSIGSSHQNSTPSVYNDEHVIPFPNTSDYRDPVKLSHLPTNDDNKSSNELLDNDNVIQSPNSPSNQINKSPISPMINDNIKSSPRSTYDQTKSTIFNPTNNKIKSYSIDDSIEGSGQGSFHESGQGSIASKYSQNTYGGFSPSEDGFSDGVQEAPVKYDHNLHEDNEKTPNIPIRQPNLNFESPKNNSKNLTRNNSQYNNNLVNQSPISPAGLASPPPQFVRQSPLLQQQVSHPPPPFTHTQPQAMWPTPSNQTLTPNNIQPSVSPIQQPQQSNNMMPPFDPNMMMGNQAAFFQAMMAAQQAFQSTMWQLQNQNPQSNQQNQYQYPYPYQQQGLSSPSQFSTQVQSPFQQQTQRYISQSPPPPPPIPSTNTHPINPSIFMPNNHNPNNNDE